MAFSNLESQASFTSGLLNQDLNFIETNQKFNKHPHWLIIYVYISTINSLLLPRIILCLVVVDLMKFSLMILLIFVMVNW